MSSAKTVIFDSMHELDTVLWIEEINKEWARVYKDYYWNLDLSTVDAARNQYRRSKIIVNSVDYSSSSSIINGLKAAEEVSLKNTVMLKNSTTWPDLTDSTLQALIDSSEAITTSIQTSITSLSTAKETLDSTIASSKASIEAAKKTLELTKLSSWWHSQAISSAESVLL